MIRLPGTGSRDVPATRAPEERSRMTLRTMILAGGLLLAVGASALVPIAEGSESGSMSPRGTNFFSDCRFSHSAPDDPIVRPGLPGASHPHEFFGNTSTDARSSLQSLLAHGTTCMRKADTAAYWVPALYRSGHSSTTAFDQSTGSIRFLRVSRSLQGAHWRMRRSRRDSCSGTAPTRPARSSRRRQSQSARAGGPEWSADARRGTSA